MAFMCAATLCLKFFLLICLQPTMGNELDTVKQELENMTEKYNSLSQVLDELMNKGNELDTVKQELEDMTEKYRSMSQEVDELMNKARKVAEQRHFQGNVLDGVIQEVEFMAVKTQKMEWMCQDLEELKKKGDEWDALPKKMEDSTKKAQRLEDLSSRLDKLEEKSTYTVSFRATRTSWAYLYKNNKIIFTDVDVNDGNAYNKRTGVFTAPIKGLYYFTLTLTAFWGNGGHAYAHIDSKRHRRTYRLLATLDAQDGKYQDLSTVAASTVLDAGESVYAMVYHRSKLQSYEYRRLNQFSGYLVRALY